MSILEYILSDPTLTLGVGVLAVICLFIFLQVIVPSAQNGEIEMLNKKKRRE